MSHRPHWMTDDQPEAALVRIASGEGPPLAAHEATAILNSVGEVLAMAGGAIIRAERAERRLAQAQVGGAGS